jgi:tetratricopeptide (TPR) repeat protein
MGTGFELWVYGAFATLIGCLALVHYRLYRHFRHIQQTADVADRLEDRVVTTGGREWIFDPELVTVFEQGALPGLELLESALVREPQRADLLEILAHHSYCRRDLGRAIELYRRALAIAPLSVQGHFYMGNVYYLNRDPENAIRHWTLTLEQGPESEYGSQARSCIQKLRASGWE